MEPVSPGHPQIIYEGYLHKTPPLDKLFVSWKKRWFVLCRTDLTNPNAVELCYYTDPMKQEKKGSYPLTKVVKIHPSFSKSKDHSFAIELKDHKFLVKAPDGNSKNIWVAKLCEFNSQDLSFHVTVPYQPSAPAAEASLRLSTPKTVIVVSPSTGKPVMEIPFNRIRRLGYEVVYGSDVIWFESCECNGQMQEDFLYFVVKSGMAAACQVIHELKLKIEQVTGAFLILEKSDNTEVTYKTRAHYGHKEFPNVIRARILQAGLCGLNRTWPMSLAGGRDRRQSEFTQASTLSASVQGRRYTVETVLGLGGSSRTPSPSSPMLNRRDMQSPSPHRTLSPSPSPTTSPNHSGGKMTLDQMTAYTRPTKNSKSSHGSKSEQFDSGVTLDVFDESRHSAPSYISMAPTPSIHRQLQNPQGTPPPRHKPTLKQFAKRHGKTEDLSSERTPPPLPSRKLTLNHLVNHDLSRQLRTSAAVRRPSHTFPSKDSSLGTSADVDLDDEYEPLSLANGHPQRSIAYDHLPERTRKLSPAVPPRSLHSLQQSHDSPYFVET